MENRVLSLPTDFSSVADVLKLGTQLFTAGENVSLVPHEPLIDVPTSNDQEPEREAEFNQLLIFDLGATESSEEKSTSFDNYELASGSPLFQTEPPKTLEVTRTTSPKLKTTLIYQTAESLHGDLPPIVASEPRSPKPVPELFSRPEQISISDSIQTLEPIPAPEQIPIEPLSQNTPSFEMPPPSLDEFDFTETKSFESILDADVSPQLVPTLPSVTEPIVSSPSQADAVSPREITRTVVDHLVQEVQLTENGEHKRLTLQLRPAELGQVTLQLDWEHESLKLRIISNEIVTSEILNQHKTELVSMLAEQGIDFESLDLSYERDTSQGEPQKKDSNSRTLDPAFFASDSTAETEEINAESDSSILDITA